MLDVQMIRDNNRITINTDQYLQWTSNHPVHQKLGFVRTLMHCAETLIRDEGRMKTEKEKVRVALRNCRYPEWALKEGDQLGKKQKRKEETLKGQNVKDRQEQPKKACVCYRTRRWSQRDCKEPTSNITSSSSAKLGTASEMQSHA